jgi:hypothetical protein
LENKVTFQTNEEILAAFRLVLPYLNHIVREDIAVSLTDLNEYLVYYRAKEFELDLPNGKPIKGIQTIEESIRTGKDTFADVPTEVYGRPIKTIFTPIYGSINKEIIGTLSSGIDQQCGKPGSRHAPCIRKRGASRASAGDLAAAGQAAVRAAQVLAEKTNTQLKFWALSKTMPPKRTCLA